MNYAPILDISSMEAIQCEHEMSKRLYALGWQKTEQFTGYTIYLGKRNPATKQRKKIGGTIFHPHKGPAACTHYALPID